MDFSGGRSIKQRKRNEDVAGLNKEKCLFLFFLGLLSAVWDDKSYSTLKEQGRGSHLNPADGCDQGKKEVWIVRLRLIASRFFFLRVSSYRVVHLLPLVCRLQALWMILTGYLSPLCDRWRLRGPDRRVHSAGIRLCDHGPARGH